MVNSVGFVVFDILVSSVVKAVVVSRVVVVVCIAGVVSSSFVIFPQ